MLIRNALTILDRYVANLHGFVLYSDNSSRVYRFDGVKIKIKAVDYNTFKVEAIGFYSWGCAVDNTTATLFGYNDNAMSIAQSLEETIKKKIRRAGY
jgi:hypothetical protein